MTDKLEGVSGLVDIQIDQASTAALGPNCGWHPPDKRLFPARHRMAPGGQAAVHEAGVVKIGRGRTRFGTGEDIAIEQLAQRRPHGAADRADTGATRRVAAENGAGRCARRAADGGIASGALDDVRYGDAAVAAAGVDAGRLGLGPAGGNVAGAGTGGWRSGLLARGGRQNRFGCAGAAHHA